MRTATKKLSAMWAELSQDPEFKLKLKAQDTAVTLARAVAESGLSQADLAKALDWKPSRVSRVLHGDSNLTLRTIMEVAEACDLNFDVILRRPGEPRAAQPWEQGAIQEDGRDNRQGREKETGATGQEIEDMGCPQESKRRQLFSPTPAHIPRRNETR